MEVIKTILNSIKTILNSIKKLGIGDGYYANAYCDCGDGKIIYDREIADYTAKHMHLLDRLSMRKTTTAVLISFDILKGACDEPNVGKEKPNWKYFRDV